MTTEQRVIAARPLRALVGRPAGGDWEYVLWDLAARSWRAR